MKLHTLPWQTPRARTAFFTTKCAATAILIVNLVSCGFMAQVEGTDTAQYSDLSHSDHRPQSLFADDGNILALAETADMVKLHGLLESSTTCDTGFEAFQETVYPHLRDHCVRCHDQQQFPGPRFATDVAEHSYSRVLSYQNFGRIDASRFVTKGGNMHCLQTYGFDCNTDHSTLADLVQSWWDQGEQNCPGKGNFFSSPLAIPSDLPTRAEGFQTIRWPLRSIGPDFAGDYFEAEMQWFTTPQDDSLGSYRLRRPRLLNSGSAVGFADVKFLLNGHFNPQGAAFTMIASEQVAKPLPSDMMSSRGVLSTHTLILLQTSEADEISLSFEDLQATDSVACKDLETFVRQTKPALQIRNCYQCHGGGPDQDPGEEVARARFSMDLGDEDLCLSMRERFNRENFEESPLVLMPTIGSFGHPRVFTGMDEADIAFGAWWEGEFR